VIFKVRVKGGEHSGNFGHTGRPGQVGGSGASGVDISRLHSVLSQNTDNPEFGRANYGTEDHVLESTLHGNGFDGLPDVVSKEKMDQHIKDGDTELWRGISPGGSIITGGTPPVVGRAQQYAELFKTGKMYCGTGVHGSGVYTSTDKGEATDFAGGRGAVIRMSLKANAKTVHYTDVVKSISDEYHKTGVMTPNLIDEGRWAASHGYDAIHVPGTFLSTDEWIVLNRTALRVDSHTYTEAELYPE